MIWKLELFQNTLQISLFKNPGKLPNHHAVLPYTGGVYSESGESHYITYK